MSQPLEYCCNCHAPTGRAGRGDDSMYLGEDGPFCEECYTEQTRVSTAARDVLAERERQVLQEGWTPEHDDLYGNQELAYAASSYAGPIWNDKSDKDCRRPPIGWPWSHEWWKPADRRRDLVKAGALILAEIERLDRLAAKQQ